MNKPKNIIFALLIIFFLLFSFYPTIFELQRKDNLADKRREFILEHNYYWPDYNLYLSKIKQGIQGRATAVEKYTSEIHSGSLIQEFYLVLGHLGKILNLDPNSSYLLGRIILSPLLLIIIFLLTKYYFPSFGWQILAFIATVASGSFPRIFTDSQGITHIGRYMEWWSNIDALQRITFIPHILFAQVISFYLLYQITINRQQTTKYKLLLYIILGNILGIVFPPSLITLDSVFILILLITALRKVKLSLILKTGDASGGPPIRAAANTWSEHEVGVTRGRTRKLLFLIFTAPSLIYLFFITKHLPWSTLVDFHRTHPMMIPFDQYILGTGPIFFLGLVGAILSIVKRDKKFQPLIFWVLSTFGFAAFFSVIKDQSPLRFTQTGLFIPLGLLGSYFFYQVWQYILNQKELEVSEKFGIEAAAFIILVSLYILGSLYIMKTSLTWQTTWITQRLGADVPPVPYPPQTMYPLSEWMDGIRWLKNNTDNNDVVLAEITAANHIPAYSGNTVYWGQSNTVDYDRKEKEVDQFFTGKMSTNQAQLFLQNGRIKYIFFSIQEKDLPAGLPDGKAGEAGKSGDKNLDSLYPFLKTTYQNNLVTVYTTF